MLLLLVITTASVAVAVLGFGMCRVAAFSESRYAVEVADWVATSTVVGQGVGPAEAPGEHLALDARGEAFGATG
jgi:hypothetical protein